MLPFALLKDEDYFGALKSKILVVDDNSDVRKLVLHLRQSGYDAIEAATSLEALTGRGESLSGWLVDSGK